jgi:hypothetical protein
MTSEATSRMDRLEAVMEQLVLLKVTQLQQHHAQQMVFRHHSKSSSAVQADGAPRSSMSLDHHARYIQRLDRRSCSHLYLISIPQR